MKNFIKDMLDQMWTFIGLFIAWVCLEGSAKEVVGWSTIAGLILWVATYKLRNHDDK